MKFRYILTVIVLGTFCILIPVSYAETVVEFGVYSGGDEITLLSDTGALLESTKSGGKFSFALGGTRKYADKIEGQLSIGIKSDTHYTAENEASWVRYPVNAMLFYHNEDFRVGLGVTAHLTPKFKISGTTKNATSTYKNALGSVVEIDYRINQQFHIGLRYTNIEYIREDDSMRFNADSVGLLLVVIM